MSELIAQQKEVCARFDADFVEANLESVLGISKNFLSGILPLNGLRHPQEGQTCGWYLWSGEELSDAPDFFDVWHVHHVVDRRPDVAKYLGLAPGWRFLLAGDHEDVWFDAKLLDV
jgi:hypothetical protein